LADFFSTGAETTLFLFYPTFAGVSSEAWELDGSIAVPDFVD
jgi:hypothetical protein